MGRIQEVVSAATEANNSMLSWTVWQPHLRILVHRHATLCCKAEHQPVCQLASVGGCRQRVCYTQGWRRSPHLVQTPVARGTATKQKAQRDAKCSGGWRKRSTMTMRVLVVAHSRVQHNLRAAMAFCDGHVFPVVLAISTFFSAATGMFFLQATVAVSRQEGDMFLNLLLPCPSACSQRFMPKHYMDHHRCSE